MSDLRERTFLAFREELQKEASLADLAAGVTRAAPRLKNIGSLGGVGAAVGAIGGAGLGAVHDYHAAREQGAGVGAAITHGVGGALGGATHGALAGGILGAGAGAFAKKDFSGLAQRDGVLGAGSRFGQRQMHSVTGMLHPKELEDVRGGAWSARQALAKANETKHEGSAAKTLAVTEAATGVGPNSMNLTSLPGYLSAVKERGIGKTLRTGMREQLTSGGLPMLALGVGVPALNVAHSLGSKDETDAVGRGERVGQEIGRAVGDVAGGVMPLAGQIVARGAFGAVGRLAGRGIDKLRGKGGAPGMGPSTLEPTEGQHTPSERVTSPAAAGQQTDIGL